MKNKALSSGFAPAFYEALFGDLTKHFSSYECCSDFASLLSRYENEGFSYVSQTLPLLGKAVEASLVTLEVLNLPGNMALQGTTALPRLFKLLHDEVV